MIFTDETVAAINSIDGIEFTSTEPLDGTVLFHDIDFDIFQEIIIQ